MPSLAEQTLISSISPIGSGITNETDADSHYTDWLDITEQAITGRVSSTTSSLDRYIAREEYDENAVDKSYLSLQFIQNFAKSGNHNFNVRIRSRIDMPSSKSKWGLFFDSEPDDFDSLEEKVRDSFSGSESLEDASDTATAGLVFDNQRSIWDNRLHVGARIKSPLDPYTKIRTSRVDYLGSAWTSRFGQQVYYYHSEGWGAKTDISFYRPMGAKYLFRFSNSGQFDDKENNWNLYQGLSLYQPINSDRLIEYRSGYVVDTRPNFKVSSYWVAADWYQHIYKQWLFLKVTPGLNFYRDNDFKASPTFRIELEAYFSPHSRKDVFNVAAPLRKGDLTRQQGLSREQAIPALPKND